MTGLAQAAVEWKRWSLHSTSAILQHMRR